jgi:MerR family copper efflux transcriptional regulator
MNIGQAALETGISAKMIRYYESTGLLPRPSRSRSGYRTYKAQDLHTLHFIRRARDFGFSMKQIRSLLHLWFEKRRPCRDVKEIALAHVEDLDARIVRLTELRNTLSFLADNCHGDGRPDCPILERLESGDAALIS